MPHVAVGDTPGFVVVDIAECELIELIQPARVTRSQTSTASGCA